MAPNISHNAIKNDGKEKKSFLRLYVQFFENYLLYKLCPKNNKHNRKRII